MSARGTYKYTVWHKGTFGGVRFQPAYFTHHTVRVEIIETLAKQYRVKFTDFHKDGRGPGTITCVQHSSVALDGAPIVEPNLTSAPGREIKLPYKDD